MTDASNRIVQKLWSFCQVLRDDGLSYQDYLEQLTFLLFLKMADERAGGGEQPIPEGYRWKDLAAPDKEGARLEEHYRETLKALGEAGGMLGLVFRKAQNKIQDPAKLRQLVVELTETGFEAGRGRLAAQLERLRAAGVGVAVDDLGTGYSSLARLVELPVDMVKIDRAFVAAMVSDPRSLAVVRSVVALPHSGYFVVYRPGWSAQPHLARVFGP